MTFERLALLALASTVLGACSQQPVTVPLRSLERSGEVAFVCVDPNDDSGHPGREINTCPDFANQEAKFYALVTQTRRGEVAVVDISGGRVVDSDPSTPGFNFLPIGAQPRDIVATPGGAASFVGVAEAGREGIYGLASSCILPPARDLLSWPACAPAERTGRHVRRPGHRDGRHRIPAARAAPTSAADPADSIEHECSADLSLEPVVGRHKLVVVMPQEGMLAVIDAQRLLDRVPGSFDACPIDRWVSLDTSMSAPPPPQVAPPDLVAPGCDPTPLNHGPPVAPTSLPGGAALSGNDLYVSDRGAPVVHVLDVSDPCNPVARPPLLPASWVDPGSTITTNDVAISPETTDGKRFAYAIDETDGSVMIFDVSADSSNRTPIVRPRSPRFPFEPPDRIAFSAPARDVEFVIRDQPHRRRGDGGGSRGRSLRARSPEGGARFSPRTVPALGGSD